MASIRRRGKKSWQIDYFEPPQDIVLTFEDEGRARDKLEDAVREDDNATREQLDNGVWQLSYHGKKRVRMNIKGTRKEAEAELAKRVSMIVENPRRYLEIQEQKQYTFDQLVERYKEHFKDQESYQTGKGHHVDILEEEFRGRMLDSITYYDCENFKLKRKRAPTRSNKQRSMSTLNKEVGTLRHMMNKAVEWEMLKQSPFDRGKSLQEKVNNQKTRFLTEDEIQRLLKECPSHLKEIVTFAINTGMRMGEISNLKHEDIRNGFIYIKKAKNNEARQIPVNEDVKAILKTRRKRLQLKSPYVFCHEDTVHRDKDGQVLQYEPIKRINKGFRTACKRAGIEDATPHTLRHTFASHLVMKGIPMKVVQELMGHKSITMTMRYSHLAQESKMNAVHALNGLTSGQSEKGKNQKCHILSQNGDFGTERQGACNA